MPDQDHNGVNITAIENRSIVSLTVANGSIAQARKQLPLADALCAADLEPRSLWVGPNHWLLISDTVVPEALLKRCHEALAGIVYNALDQSAGLAVFRVTGYGGRELLATGSGLDLRADSFAVGACCRTRLAKIATTIVAAYPETLEIYLDRSYAHYFDKWLTDAISIAALAVAAQA